MQVIRPTWSILLTVSLQWSTSRSSIYSKVTHPTGDRLLTESLQWSTSRSPILQGTGCWQNRYSEQHQGHPSYRGQAVDRIITVNNIKVDRIITVNNIKVTHPSGNRLLTDSLQRSTSRSSINIKVTHSTWDRLLTESLQWTTSRSPILPETGCWLYYIDQHQVHPSYQRQAVDRIITVVNIKVIHPTRGQAVDRIITVINIKVIHRTRGQAVDRIITVINIKVTHPTGGQAVDRIVMSDTISMLVASVRRNRYAGCPDLISMLD